MLKAAIEKLIHLAPITTRDLLGRTYADRAMSAVTEPTVSPLAGHTLTGLKSFLAAEKIENPVVHIESFDSVALVSSIFGPWKQRETYMEAGAYPVKFSFGNWYDLESFVIAMQTCFVQNVTAKSILAIVGNLSTGAITTLEDDGITQSATVKAGVTRKAKADVPNPVMLAPYRTFPEVIQPESPFVFRLRDNGDNMPSCGLFEADGGAWKNDAIGLIKGWFEANLPGVNVIA